MPKVRLLQITRKAASFAPYNGACAAILIILSFSAFRFPPFFVFALGRAPGNTRQGIRLGKSGRYYSLASFRTDCVVMQRDLRVERRLSGKPILNRSYKFNAL